MDIPNNFSGARNGLLLSDPTFMIIYFANIYLVHQIQKPKSDILLQEITARLVKLVLVGQRSCERFGPQFRNWWLDPVSKMKAFLNFYSTFLNKFGCLMVMVPQHFLDTIYNNRVFLLHKIRIVNNYVKNPVKNFL